MSTLKKPKNDFLYQQALNARKNARYAEFISILDQGKKNNDADCIYELAMCYYHGYCGFIGDKQEALKLLKKNIKNNHLPSLSMLGSMYNDIYKTNKANILGKKVLSSSIIDHFALGLCYFHGIGTVEDQEKAFDHFLKSTQDNNIEAMDYLAECYNHFDDNTNEFIWYVKSAELGYIHSFITVSDCYYFGKGTLNDYEKALYWNKKFFIACSGYDYNHALSFKLELDGILTISNVDSKINFGLARYYLAEKDEYLSWYFFKKTKEIDAKKELKKLEETIFKSFVKCHKVVITLLCIGKYSKYPKEVFMLIAKELWKTKHENVWKDNYWSNLKNKLLTLIF